MGDRSTAMCSSAAEADETESGVRLLECEYLTSITDTRGYGACRDNTGTTYKLLFSRRPDLGVGG